MKVVRTIVTILGLLAALFVASVGAAAAWIHGRQAASLAKQRREAHRYPEWAAEHQLEYAERDDDRLEQLVGPMGVFTELGESGAVCRVAHVFASVTDPRAPALLQLAVFPKPSAKAAVHFTVAVARLPSMVPNTTILARTRAMSRHTTRIGHEAFDATYVMVSDDPAWVRAVLGRELIAWLLAFPEKERPDIRLRGEWASCSRLGPLQFAHGKRALDDLLGFLDRADGLG